LNYLNVTWLLVFGLSTADNTENGEVVFLVERDVFGEKGVVAKDEHFFRDELELLKKFFDVFCVTGPMFSCSFDENVHVLGEEKEVYKISALEGLLILV